MNGPSVSYRRMLLPCESHMAKFTLMMMKLSGMSR